MTERPTGAVTFLFTDVEGSTRLWEAHPETMRSALAEHDSIVREAIESASGYVFSTAGDAFSAAFSDPGNAIVAAVSAQLRLSQQASTDLGPLRVRMSIHSGVAHERDGDYFGPALNRAARILGAAHGGQVIVSSSTEELLRHGALPDGVGLHDLGEHQLKDLGRSEHLYQLTGRDLREEFPPVLSLDAHPNNLPVQLTSFVGRHDELTDVVKRLADNRLLTLTGVGGSGKTRLALQAAAESASDYRHGVWLVELASIGEADLVAQTLAETLGVTRNQSLLGGAGGEVRTALDHLVEYLEPRQALLVLDNCEHLIGEAAQVAAQLLRRCPGVSILATSREGLGVPGELLWQVPSLGVDDDGPARMGDAVLLFTDRASSANPGFVVDADTLPHVQAVCRRLDGMPLAIELAAARARVLSAAQISERLSDRFRLLTGGSRTAMPRQQTLEATVDWSHDLLEDSERLLFRRLAVFRDGFTLEAAEHVASDELIPETDVLDLLGQLVDKSMVVRDEDQDRFHMLETLRQYALGKLSESDEVADVRTRHAETFLRLVQQAEPHLRGPNQLVWLDRIESDHGNLRAAVAFSLENGIQSVAVRITDALQWFWLVRGPLVEMVEWLERCSEHLGSVDEATALRVRTSMAMVFSVMGHGDYPERSAVLAAEVVREAEELGDPTLLGHALSAQSFSLQGRSDLDGAIDSSRRARIAFSEAGDEWGQGWAALSEGWTYRLQAKVDEATAVLEEAITHFRNAGDESRRAWATSAVAIMARYRLRFEDEVRMMEEAAEVFDRQGNRNGIQLTNSCIGISLTHLGRFDEAIERMETGLRLRREDGIPGSDAETLGLLVWASDKAGDLVRLRRYVPEAIESARRLGDPLVLVQNLEKITPPLLKAGHADKVAQVIGYSDHQRTEAGRPQPPPNVEEWEALRARTEEVLGDGFAALRDSGTALQFDEAIALGVRASGLILE